MRPDPVLPERVQGRDVGKAVLGERAVPLEYRTADRCLRGHRRLPEEGTLIQGFAGACGARNGTPGRRDRVAKGGREG